MIKRIAYRVSENIKLADENNLKSETKLTASIFKQQKELKRTLNLTRKYKICTNFQGKPLSPSFSSNEQTNDRNKICPTSLSVGGDVFGKVAWIS